MNKYYICETDDCQDEDCQYHCEHEFDPSEGYTCLNCGAQGDIGALIDATDYNQER